MEARWFENHVAYTMAKFGMSMRVLGRAAEFKKQGVGANALWPRTTIATIAVNNLLGGEELMEKSRKPSIMGDASCHILSGHAKSCTGNFFIDDTVLAEEGITDLSHYSVDPTMELAPDFFI